MLLMSLEPDEAAALLQGLEATTVADLAVEVSQLYASGYTRDRAETELAEEIHKHMTQEVEVGPQRFVELMVRGAVGDENCPEVLSRVDRQVMARDPFREIRKADLKDLATVVGGESPQVAAMVLSELSPDKSGQMLNMLEADFRRETVRCMAGGGAVSTTTKIRVAQEIRRRLDALSAGGMQVGHAAENDQREKQLRKVAILLRGLEREERETLVSGIGTSDEEAAKLVAKYMVLWEDVRVVSDRPMQEVLREVEARSLALAMVGADESTCSKIRNNMSERALALVDEEAQLLSKPRQKEIDAAREEILEVMRDLNFQGMLSFDGEGE